MNFEMTKCLKALDDSITLLGLYIKEKPNTIEESNALYSSYYLGGIGRQEPTVEEYIVRLYEDCGIMSQFMEGPKGEIDKYADSILRIFDRAERTGLFDCKCYSYINTSDAAKEPPSYIEWKRRYLHGLFSIVSTTLINIKGKFSVDNSIVHYSDELLNLFHRREELINELIGKSDNEIAFLIKKWAKQKDDNGGPLIENPNNRLQTSFAEELKRNNLIKLSAETFRKKL